MAKVAELVLTASKADDKGRRLIVVMHGKQVNRSTFDPDIQFQRRDWRNELVKLLRIEPSSYCSSGDAMETAIHSDLEERLQAAVEAADAEPTSALWQPAVTTMADIDHATTDWLWPQHIPAGAISNLSGDPGLGKS